MVSAYDFAINIVMLINVTINKTLNIHDLVKKIIYAASTYDFAVNIVMVINITLNKTFNIYDLHKNYSCYNIFNRENINTFCALTVIQTHADSNGFTQIKNGQG